MRYFLFVILIILFCSARGQLFDSIQESFKYKPKLLLKMDARNSFVTASYSKVKGVKLGLNYHNIFRFGVGYSWMQTKYNTIYKKDSANLRFGYVNAFLEYTFYQAKQWQFDIPVQIGFGRIAYKSDKNEVIAHQWVPVWEPAMTFEYLFLRYFGIGVGAGYRLIIKSKTPISEQFTSPIYVFKFRVSFGDMYKDVKKYLPEELRY